MFCQILCIACINGSLHSICSCEVGISGVLLSAASGSFYLSIFGCSQLLDLVAMVSVSVYCVKVLATFYNLNP